MWGAMWTCARVHEVRTPRARRGPGRGRGQGQGQSRSRDRAGAGARARPGPEPEPGPGRGQSQRRGRAPGGAPDAIALAPNPVRSVSRTRLRDPPQGPTRTRPKGRPGRGPVAAHAVIRPPPPPQSVRNPSVARTPDATTGVTVP
ncbi:hypothetical protein GCM10027162_14270 [Streptomyces incanus]